MKCIEFKSAKTVYLETVVCVTYLQWISWQATDKQWNKLCKDLNAAFWVFSMEQAKCIPCVAISFKYNITYIIPRLPSTEPRASHSTYVKSGKKKKEHAPYPMGDLDGMQFALHFSVFHFSLGNSRIKNIFISKACQVMEIDNRQSLKEFLIYLRFNLQPAAQSVCWLLLLHVPVIIFRLPVPPRQ